MTPIEREHQFDLFSREVSRRGVLKAGALGLTLLFSKLLTTSRLYAEEKELESIFDIELHPNQSYFTPNSHFLTVKGDVLVDGEDVKKSSDANLGTIGRTFRTRVEIVAPYGANIHGNSNRCEADAYYQESMVEMKEKGCLNGCGDLREWYRGNPGIDVCQPVGVKPVVFVPPTPELILPSPGITVTRGVCVTESPLKPGQALPTDPIDYEVCAGATIFVPRQSIIQGDVQPIENGRPRETWHDSRANTGLITITGRDGYWRFLWGGDVYVDPDLDRLLQYAQNMAILMRSKGCGTGIGCPEGVSILRWPDDFGQGE